MKRFFLFFDRHFSLKRKMWLGFSLIILLTAALGYVGYWGMVRVKYATEYQMDLSHLIFRVMDLTEKENSLLAEYSTERRREIGDIIQSMLAQETGEQKMSFGEKIFYYTTFTPKEMKLSNAEIWSRVRDLMLKMVSINQLLDRRWAKDGPLARIAAQGKILRDLLIKVGWDVEATQLELLEAQCTSRPRPKVINRMLDRLYKLQEEVQTLALDKEGRNKIDAAIGVYMDDLKFLKDVDANIVFLEERLHRLLSTAYQEQRDGMALAQALVRRAVAMVFWETSAILLLVILLSIWIGWRVIENITTPMERIISVIRRAREGDFSQAFDLPERRDEMGVLANWFMELMASLKANVGVIIEKSGEILTSRVFHGQLHRSSSNPLTVARDTVETLVRINKYKSLIEGDLDKREIYRHLSLVLEGEFGLTDYIILEMNESENRLEPMPSPSMDRYSLDVLIQPSLCRVKRTGEVANSLEFPEICSYADLREGEFHICLPILMGGEVKGVLRIYGREEEKEGIFQNLPYIAKYIETTAPVVYASKLLEITREQSLRDGLTGLYNRRFLEGYLEKQVRFAQRKGFTMGFLMLDIDHFKKTNDEYGHKAGDLILQQIARVVERSVRSSDLVIRYGGEEFLVILPEVAPGNCVQIAEKLRTAVETTPFKIDGGKEVRVTLSIGVAELPTHSDHPWQAIKFADVALYHAKNEGRNRVVLFSPDMWQEETEERAEEDVDH